MTRAHGVMTAAILHERPTLRPPPCQGIAPDDPFLPQGAFVTTGESDVRRTWNLLIDYSVLLVVGAIVGLVWANVEPDSYHHFIHYPLWSDGPIGLTETVDGRTRHVFTIHYLVNDLLMALFFAVAAKEVWEAVVLPHGSLRGRKAITPLIATLGGMVGPVAVYLALGAVWGVLGEIAHGWAIPTATDIAFAYLVGCIVFGARHPAVSFLLLLAIADDAGGLVILAIFYPTGVVAPVWLLLSLAAAVGVWALASWLPRRLDRGDQARPHSTRTRRVLGSWPYVIAGCLSWYAFFRANLHPALGLLPIVPAVPHAARDFGIFANGSKFATDLLNSMQHALRIPVQLILFAFGFANAGVEFSAISSPTWIVLVALVAGKPVGILLFGWFAASVMKLGLPEGMRMSDLPIIGLVAAIGFTVALFVAAVAFEPGSVQDAAKMGALFSLVSLVPAVIAGRLAGIRRVV